MAAPPPYSDVDAGLDPSKYPPVQPQAPYPTEPSYQQYAQQYPQPYPQQPVPSQPGMFITFAASLSERRRYCGARHNAVCVTVR